MGEYFAIRNIQNFWPQTNESIVQKYEGLFGAILGVIISFAFTLIYTAWQRGKKARAILHELTINRGLLPQKIEHLTEIGKALKDGRVLPGDSVRLLSGSYDSFISDVGYDYFPKILANLHIIHGRMKNIDSFMDRFFMEYLTQKNLKIIDDPNTAYSKMCDEIAESCRLAMNLIDEVLEKSPRNVLW